MNDGNRINLMLLMLLLCLTFKTVHLVKKFPVNTELISGSDPSSLISRSGKGTGEYRLLVGNNRILPAPNKILIVQFLLVHPQRHHLIIGIVHQISLDTHESENGIHFGTVFHRKLLNDLRIRQLVIIRNELVAPLDYPVEYRRVFSHQVLRKTLVLLLWRYMNRKGNDRKPSSHSIARIGKRGKTVSIRHHKEYRMR